MKNLWVPFQILVAILFSLNLYAQWDEFIDIPYDTDPTRGLRKSSNGYILSTQGEIRVLFIFFEMVYQDPNNDPSLNGTANWPVHELPNWANGLFDYNPPQGQALGSVTRYYQDASSGSCIVLGDYLLAPNNGGVFQINTSNGYFNENTAIGAVNNALGQNFETAHLFTSLDDFDMWTPTSIGLEKDNVGNDKWDQVVFIVRNAIYPANSCGWSGQWTGINPLLGYYGDTRTVECTYGSNPTNVIRHEFAHDLLGTNSFHAGGGGVPDFQPFYYWIPRIGGWSLLGLYGCSLLTWNSWDRQRLGWYTPGNQYNPAARNSSNSIEVNGDLDATIPSDAGVYVLRDFVTTGDAIRIKLPFLDSNTEFPEFLWIENHQGIGCNNNPFDQWQYQPESCVQDITPGLMCYIQIDREVRETDDPNLLYYSGGAGYLRPLVASGNWDRIFPSYTTNTECVNWEEKRPFIRNISNPLTGGCDQEYYSVDHAAPLNILTNNDEYENWTEEVNGQYYKHLYQYGNTSHVFTLNGNKKIGVSTNPSSMPLMNLANYNGSAPAAHNVRKIHINGVSVEIISVNNGNIELRIRFDDINIDNDVRWCADEIILNPISTPSGISLNLKSGKNLTLDQGLTATRINDPITYNGDQVFASPTLFRVLDNAVFNMEEESQLIVQNGSTLKLEEGSKLIVNDGAELVIKDGSHLYVADCAALKFMEGGQLIAESGATLHISEDAYLFFANGLSNIDIDNGVIIAQGTINPEDIIFPYLIVNSNITISSESYVMPETLTVEQNGVLTINSSTLRFTSSQSKIIVKPKGKLVLDGSTLTSTCGYFWNGIEVWGISDSSQYNSQGQLANQGQLFINQSTIENAIFAVELWHPNEYDETGGIIYADSSSFINNAKSIHAVSYRNFNPVNPTQEMNYCGLFTYCNFEINENYLGDATFYKHVDLYDVNGINFEGCDFSVVKDVRGVDQWNMGIASYDAGFSAIGICTHASIPCEEYDSCRFTGFYRAIYADNHYNTYTFRVNNVHFINNTYGVYMLRIPSASIINSNFEIGENDSDDKIGCLLADGIGIYGDYSHGFAIEENTFSKWSGAPSGIYLGTWINNTNSTDEIYKNFFSGLSYANYSQGKNWSYDVYHGLTYFCNENSNNYADFYVGTDIGGIGGIQALQGDNNHPTGNTFSQNNVTWHFYNGGNGLIGYYYCNGCQYQTPNANKIYHVIPVGIKVENYCPSHYGGHSGTGVQLNSQEQVEAETSYGINLLNYNNVASLYNDLIDGGSTESELSEIQNAQQDDMWELRAKLLGDSPHLSLDVLKEAANRTDVLNDVAIFDILSANPDELRKDELISFLENKENPLPEYMIEILRQVAEGTTYKTVLQEQMAFYNTLKTRAANDMIRSILNNPIIDYDSLRAWLNNLGGLTADRQIIASYITQGNYSSALALANMLPDLYSLEGNDLIENNYYLDLLELYSELNQNSLNYFQLDSLNIELLNMLAENSNGVAGIQAKSILEANGIYHTINCPCFDSTNAFKQGLIIPGVLPKVYEMKITVKPNPANQWASFEYTLPDGDFNGTITISNASGEKVDVFSTNGQQGQILWDTRTVPSGVYLYILEAGGLKQSGKIVIKN